MRRGNRSLSLTAWLCCAVGISTVTGLSLAWAAPAATPQDRVDAAYAAMGASKLKTISLKAHLDQFDPGESYSAGGPPLDAGVSDLVQSRDLVRGFTRNEWARTTPEAVREEIHAPIGTKLTYTEIITPTAGYVIGYDMNFGILPKRATKGPSPEHTMSSLRLTETLRELTRPMIVIEMKQHPDRVTAIADQTVAGRTYPAVQYRSDLGTFIVTFDPATNLLAHVRTWDWDPLEGDSIFDAEYSDWRDIDGVKIAFRTLYTLNGMWVEDLKLSSVTVNPVLAPESFNIPEAMLASAEKPAPASVTPFQRIFRRQFWGFYYDSDVMDIYDGNTLTLADVAPNISLTQGGTHNTLFIATDTYLIAVDSPGFDDLSVQSINLAKQKYPGKPIRYLILTHHHVDHAGGLRAYAAEGATIVVGKGNGDYIREALARPETLNWNAPKTAFAAKVIEVDGSWSVNDGGREVDAYIVENPHAAAMLFAYVPDAKLGFVTDLYTPGFGPAPSNKEVASLVKAVDKWGIKPERFAGGHGLLTGPYANLVKAAQKVPADPQ